MSALLEAPNLTLDPVGHIYRLGDRVLPSVSEILVGTGIVDTQWFTEYGRWRGSAVHQACWFDDENDLDEDTIVDTEAFTRKELLGHVAGWRKFRRETGFVPRAIERSVCNLLLGYAGTPDRDGVLGDGRPCLPDLKSGASSKATRFQTVAYAGCYPMPRLFMRMEVRTKSTGDYTLQTYGPECYQRDFAHWQNLVAVFHLKKELRIL
jgi:hypothetical protein